MPSKLPQRKLVTDAPQRAIQLVRQPDRSGDRDSCTRSIIRGYVAKRMEIGAVVGATPAKNVRARDARAPGDVVILLGGRTGARRLRRRDRLSKAHDASPRSTTCGAEVQKGNAA